MSTTKLKIIIDVNIAPKVFLINNDTDFSDLHNRIFPRRKSYILIVLGGKLAKELVKNINISRILKQLDSAGRTCLIKENLIEEDEQILNNLNICKSNDIHILSLARVSLTRLLVTKDTDLIKDFKNKNIIDNPRGKIYSSTNHNHLLEIA